MQPRLTDELDEVIIGWRIARGATLPLTSHEPYIGSLFNYLVALVFLLLGPRVEAGRLLVMLVGALTVVPTFLLGRLIGGTAVGLLAALLLTASATHIVVTSHVAYSHSLTPLFVTGGLWLLQRAANCQGGRTLVAAFFVLGLAVQTHPSALALGPGVAVFAAWKARRLAGRWLLVAALSALLAVSNLVLFNVLTGFSSVLRAAQESDRYMRYEPFSVGGWVGRFLLLLHEAPGGLAGLVSESVEQDVLRRPVVLLYLGLLLLGIGVLSRRWEWMLPLVLLSTLLGISMLSANVFPVVVRARHYAPLLPASYVAVAVAVLSLGPWGARGIGRPRLVGVALAALVVVLAVGPLDYLRRYYQRSEQAGRTNKPIYQAMDAATRSGPPTEPIYIDRTLYAARTLSGGRLLDHLALGLEIRGQRTEVVDLAQGPPPTKRESDRSIRLVVQAESVAKAAERYKLVPVAGDPGSGAPLRVVRASPKTPR